MKRLFFCLLLICGACSAPDEGPKKVGLCVVATGTYAQFVKPLIDSGRKFFCKGHEVTYFVFTDGEVEAGPDVVVVHQEKLGWPMDTLKRFHMYAGVSDRLEGLDYVYAIDADAHFVAEVGSEIFSRRVFTEHPGFWGKEHWTGGFYGGSGEEFVAFVRRAAEMVDSDLASGEIEMWHDESYLNQYVADCPPTKTLSPSYCFPEGWELPFDKKIVVVVKDHEEVR